MVVEARLKSILLNLTLPLSTAFRPTTLRLAPAMSNPNPKPCPKDLKTTFENEIANRNTDKVTVTDRGERRVLLPDMADPFEVRMRFTSQLQHLNASVTSSQKAAQGIAPAPGTRDSGGDLDGTGIGDRSDGIPRRRLWRIHLANNHDSTARIESGDEIDPLLRIRRRRRASAAGLSQGLELLARRRE